MKLSVAIASYNGEKYIEKQLESILAQSHPVDEVIISDDGSIDTTIKIVRNIADSRIVIMDNTNRGGYSGNFENAIKHCSGDYIFLADQDDIWEYNKVERFVKIIQKYPSAACIFSDGKLIDRNGQELPGKMNKQIISDKNLLKLDRMKWLEPSVSAPLSNGMAMCISKELLETAMPFPKIKGFHDHWLVFCGVCMDQCYYLNEQLVLYRLHGANTAGNSVYKGNMFNRIKKVKNKFKTNLRQTDRLELGRAMINMLEKYHFENTPAYQTASRVREIGEKEMDAFLSPRVIGAYKLVKLYCTDMRFRKSGTNDFLYKLAGILLK